MDEFGIFSGEGLLEGGFYSMAEAEAALAARYSPEAHAARCCHDHPEHEHESCPECNSEDES
jgi:hypothetical protein